MTNNVNTNEQLSRMKSLMNYGLKTESKAPYSSIENKKVGADGKVYGIVREGAKYYIKSAPNKTNLVKEDFSYIGGFRNRKDHEYDNFALAQKQFDLKMMSLKEAINKDDFNVSSWDLEKKETVVIEATEKMKNEILRERQIMKNAALITEKKDATKKFDNGAMCCDTPKTPSNNITKEKPKTGCAEDAVDHEKAELPKEMGSAKVKSNIEKIKEDKSTLGWNRDKDYMDKTHGTEIGDSAPFDGPEGRDIDDQDKNVSSTGEMKNGTVEEGASMHDADSQNTPTPGVGTADTDKNKQPFNGKKGKQIDEALDDVEGEIGADEMGEEGFGDDEMGAEEDFGDEGIEGEEDLDFGDEDEFGDDDDDVFEDDLESRMSAMEDVLNQIAAKLGIEGSPVDDEAYEDDELFGDEEDGEFEDEEIGGDEFGEDELDSVAEEEEMFESRNHNGVQIFETKAYREAMRRQRMNEEDEDDSEGGEHMKSFNDGERVPSGNMNKLDDFGKHPAYQKTVMDLPPKDMREFPGNYDMNDDSVKSDSPYGEKIGDGAPFDIKPKSIENAIAEAFRLLKKKSNRVF